jgi:hypothetical protein
METIATASRAMPVTALKRMIKLLEPCASPILLLLMGSFINEFSWSK